MRQASVKKTQETSGPIDHLPERPLLRRTTARKAAAQKLPAACPLGNEPSRGTPSGAGRPMASHGRTRPTSRLMSQTKQA